jgi:hypothetical protein
MDQSNLELGKDVTSGLPVGIPGVSSARSRSYGEADSGGGGCCRLNRKDREQPGARLWNPRSPNARDLYPTDQDPSVGTPNLGHPTFRLIEIERDEGVGIPP